MRDYCKRPEGLRAIWCAIRWTMPDAMACVLGMAGMIGAVILAAAMA